MTITATGFRRGRSHIAILTTLWLLATLLPGTGRAWVDNNHNQNARMRVGTVTRHIKLTIVR